MSKKTNHDHEQMTAPIITGYASSYIEMSQLRSIFLNEDVTKKSSAELSALLLYYDTVNHEEPIYLYINSNGGDMAGLFNIYDVMQMIKAPIKTILLGKCYSAAAVILSAGTPGERFALQSSKVMIHGTQFAFPLLGSDVVNNSNYLDFVKKYNDLVMKVLSKHTGQTLEKVKADCSREYWMTAQQAKNYGIIDNVV